MNLFLLIGIVGMALILIAFFLNNAKVWNQDDLTYDVVNFVGSMMLVIYAIPPRSWPFIVLNSVWAAVSLRDIISDIQRDRAGKQARPPKVD